MRQSPAKEAFRGCCVTLGREQKVDRLAGGIDCPIEETFLSLHLDVGFIQTPTFVRWLQMSPTALVQLWPVDLDPPPNTAGADRQTSFRGHFPHLCHRNRIAEIPAHTPHDDVARIMSPLEGIGSGDRHISPYQTGLLSFRNGTLSYVVPRRSVSHVQRPGLEPARAFGRYRPRTRAFVLC